jgi:photosynthetic reaction center M subunit
MARYHTLFTSIELDSPMEYGKPLPRGAFRRILPPKHSKLLGRFGETQVGPTYLGATGLASLICGFIAFEIIGLNMWASVDWNVIRFIKLLPFLALEPPSAKQGLSLFPPLDDGGWWLMAGFFLTASILLWWTRMYRWALARTWRGASPQRSGCIWCWASSVRS